MQGDNNVVNEIEWYSQESCGKRNTYNCMVCLRSVKRDRRKFTIPKDFFIRYPRCSSAYLCSAHYQSICSNKNQGYNVFDVSENDYSILESLLPGCVDPVENRYIVRAILGVRKRTQYQIAWSGYDDTEATWEDKDEAPQDMVEYQFKSKAAIRIAAGKQTAYAIAEDGFLYAWGDNSFGQLGINSSTISMAKTPVRVIGIQISPCFQQVFGQTVFRFENQSSFIVLFSSGSAHSVMIYNGIYCFGILSDDERACVGPDGLNETDPNVCSGNGHCVALDTCSCEVFTTGANVNCHPMAFCMPLATINMVNWDFDDPQRILPTQPFYPLSHGAYVKHIVTRYQISYALTLEGSLYSWGRGDLVKVNRGVLGDGTIALRRKPVRIMNGHPHVIHMSSSVDYAVAVTQDNMIYVWGINSAVPTIRPAPSNNYGNSTGIELACGWQHTDSNL